MKAYLLDLISLSKIKYSKLQSSLIPQTKGAPCCDDRGPIHNHVHLRFCCSLADGCHSDCLKNFFPSPNS